MITSSFTWQHTRTHVKYCALKWSENRSALYIKDKISFYVVSVKHFQIHPYSFTFIHVLILNKTRSTHRKKTRISCFMSITNDRKQEFDNLITGWRFVSVQYIIDTHGDIYLVQIINYWFFSQLHWNISINKKRLSTIIIWTCTNKKSKYFSLKNDHWFSLFAIIQMFNWYF